MKKYLFIIVTVTLFTQLAHAQSFDRDNSLPSTAFRVYCFWGTLFNDDTNNCPGARRTNVTNVQIQTPVVDIKPTTTQAPVVRQTTVYRSLPESSIRQAVENYIQSILPSLRGPQGERGDAGQAGNSFTGIPQVFWSGGGSSVSNTGGSVTNITNIYSSTSSLPTPGASGTVLTINASGTPEWLPPTYSGTSSPASTTNVLGTSGTILSSTVNGVLATTSFTGIIASSTTNSIDFSTSTNVLTSNVNGVIATTSIVALTSSTTNTATTSGNVITSTVNGVVATTTSVTSNVLTSLVNSITSTVNGIASVAASIINSFTQSLSGNVLTTTINGVSATSSVIGNNTVSSSGNVLTSDVNGVTSTTTAVNSNVITFATSTNVLTSNVNGVVSTTSIPTSGGSTNPAGANTQIQYNNSGVFGATSTFVWDNTNGRLGIGTDTPTEMFTVQGTSQTRDILPESNLTYSLGNTSKRWNEAWIGTLNVGTSTWSITQSNNGRFSLFDAPSAGGTERFTVLTNGNVGIGTTTPNSALSVQNTTNVPVLTLQTSLGQTAPVAMFTNSTGNELGRLNFVNGSVALGLSAGQAFTTATSSVAIGSSSLFNNTSGSGNIALGEQTLFSNTTASNNVALGYQSMFTNAAGEDNVALGAYTLFNNTDGAMNNAIGREALFSNTTGSWNTAIGDFTLWSNTTGGDNIAMGDSAMYNNTTGTSNIGLGFYALGENTVGNDNVGVGVYSMGYLTTGSGNSGFGVSSLQNIQDGEENVAVGLNALGTNNGGAVGVSYNVALGASSLGKLNSGIENTGVGYGSLRDGSIGTGNAALGAYSLLSRGGDYNVALGYEALSGIATSSENIAIGLRSMSKAFFSGTYGTQNIGIGTDAVSGLTTGTRNIGLGYSVLNGAGNLTGSENIGIGSFALQENTTGSSSVAIGFNALALNTTGSNNIGIGQNALPVNTTGGSNIGLGESVLSNNTTGSGNIGIGLRALEFTTTGRNHIGIGYEANSGTRSVASSSIGIGYRAGWGSQSGSYNIGIGEETLYANSTGAGNLAIGLQALRSVGFGSYNIALGHKTMASTTTGSLNVGLGYEALRLNTSGIRNVAIGAYSLRENINGEHNVGIGSQALEFNTYGEYNVAIGSAAMADNINGSYNVAIGQIALANATSSEFSVAIGAGALTYAEGDYNVAVGLDAGLNTTGSRLIAIGLDTLRGSDATDSIGIGTEALQYNGGDTNIAIGTKAIKGGAVGGTDLGSFNIGIGSSTLRKLHNGSQNIAFGEAAMEENLNGSNNIALGYSAFKNALNSSSTIAIGYEAFTSVSAASSSIALGFSSGNYSGGGLSTLGVDNSFFGANTRFSLAGITNATAIGANVTLDQSNTLILGNNANVGIGTSSPSEKLQVEGNIRFSGALMPGGLAGATNTILMSQGAGLAPVWVGTSSLLTTTNTLTFATTTGILSSDVNGVVSTTTLSLSTIPGLVNLTSQVTGVLPITNGGTGTSTLPTFGQLLMGNTLGGYDLVATSSLGITATALPAGSTTQIQFNNAGVFGATSTFVWDNTNGRLGIGTTSPSTVFAINSRRPLFTMRDNFTGQAYQVGVGRSALGNSDFSVYNSTSGRVPFVIKSDGQIGFGTSTIPLESKMLISGGTNGANVDIRGDVASGGQDQAIVEVQGYDYDTFVNSAYLAYYGSSGAGTTAGFNNQRLGVLAFGGASTSLIGTLDATPLIFFTDNAERLRIGATGNLMIGTTTGIEMFTVAGTSTMQTILPGLNLVYSLGTSTQMWKDVWASNLRVGTSSITSGTTVARFENAGGTCDVVPNVAGGITCTSDQNSKKDIEVVDPIDSLQKLLAVEVKSYRMNADEATSTKQVGFLAQQLETQFPGLVLTNEEGKKSVSYAGMTPVLTQAVQTIYKFFADIGVVVENGVAKVNEFVANRVRTKELCVGEEGDETCITKGQLDALLSGQGVAAAPVSGINNDSQGGSQGQSGTTTDSVASSTDPVVDPSPVEPAPEQPTDPVAADPVVDQTPVDPTPTETTPTEPAPLEEAPVVDPSPVDPAPTE